MFAQYYPILLVFLLTGTLVALMTALATFLGPKKDNPVKALPFESGSDPVGDTRQRSSIKFYVVAILFIIFDIEIVFLYPWALIYADFWQAGLGILLTAGGFIFMAILVLGLLYEWKRGALEWD